MKCSERPTSNGLIFLTSIFDTAKHGQAALASLG